MENTIIVDGKEISWEYTTCPCLTCVLYLKDNKSPDDKICEKSRCTYNKKLARDVANDVFFMMNNRHCEECNTWHSKEDIRFSHTCPNCGNDLI